MLVMQPAQRRFLFVLPLVMGVAWIFVSADKTGASALGYTTRPRAFD